MPGWENARDLITKEFTQSIEEGKDPVAVESLRAEFIAAGDDLEKLEQLHGKFLALPVKKDFAFQEPSDLESILRLRPANRKAVKKPENLADKMHGAWLGRCVGCALGKPVEGFMSAHNGMRSYRRLEKYLKAINPAEWPLKDYIPEHSPAEAETGAAWCLPSTREHIKFMESDDDIRYTVLGQILLNHHSSSFTTWQVACNWIERLSYKQVCTAETQAYRNLVNRYGFHMSGSWDRKDDTVDWNWVATYFNPYREWIGAQIRVDSYGYAAPGNPSLAAEFAWRDARLSHVKNGIYGAMFCAAMIAAAFVTHDPLEIIEAGLAEIPDTSRLYAEMRQVIAICQKYHCDDRQFEPVISEIYDLLEHYDPVHTNNNAGVCVMALLLSGGDFSKGVSLAVMGGFDTDCNGATVGSIVGAISGASKAPQHWTARLNDTLNSQICDYHPIAISECARRSTVIAEKIIAAY